MNYLHTEVTTRTGEAVEVVLQGQAANVLLLDDANYALYTMDRQYHYYGGHFTRSPALIRPPHPGRWHVVVDLGGGAGQVTASVRVRR